MMKVNDLRIGNYVDYNTIGFSVYSIQSCEPRQEEKFNNKDIVTLCGNDLITATIDELKPITLTEEWLLNFEFNYDKDAAIYSKTTDVCINDDGSIDFYFGEYGSWCKRIKYVHELQNLYFALTGEDLLLKKYSNEYK